MAQDPFGNLAFYPVPYRQFVISFVYTRSPQILEEAEDVPLIQDQYHKWIAWEALLKLALYDKNQQLVAYANKHASFYRRRAEANLMPLLSWRLSPFDEYDV